MQKNIPHNFRIFTNSSMNVGNHVVQYTWLTNYTFGGRGGSVVEHQTPEREVQGLNPMTAV